LRIAVSTLPYFLPKDSLTLRTALAIVDATISLDSFSSLQGKLWVIQDTAFQDVSPGDTVHISALDLAILQDTFPSFDTAAMPPLSPTKAASPSKRKHSGSVSLQESPAKRRPHMYSRFSS